MLSRLERKLSTTPIQPLNSQVKYRHWIRSFSVITWDIVKQHKKNINIIIPDEQI